MGLKNEVEDLTADIFPGSQIEDDETPVDRGDSVVAEPEEETPPVAEPDPEPEPEEAEEAPEPQVEEPEETPEVEAEKPKGKDEPRIPKSRFDEVNQRRKAAEEELRKYREREKIVKEVESFDFKGREKAYMEAVLDGDTDKALEIREEIREAERAVYTQEARKVADETTDQKRTKTELDSTINELQEKYPMFDGESEQFNEALTEEALAMYQGYLNRNVPPAEAMRRAVTNVVKLNGLDAPESVAEAPKAKAQTKATPDQVRSKLEKATRQPPSPSTREAAPRPDPMNMSEAEFDKLSATELRKLRGDFV